MNEKSGLKKSGGTVWAWGNAASGQLGNGTTTPNQWTPVQVLTGASGCVTNLCDITKIALGMAHSLALKNDATVWAWGTNISGELGINNTTNSSTPVQVLTGASGCATNLCSINAITGGWQNSRALKSDGTLWSWGQSTGDGSATSRTTPVKTLGCDVLLSPPPLPLPVELLSFTAEGINIISIYPNPSNGNFSYLIGSSTDAEVSITVFDVIGKKVIAQKLTINKGISARTINASWLSSGMYSLQVRTSNGLYKSQKQFMIK